MGKRKIIDGKEYVSGDVAMKALYASTGNLRSWRLEGMPFNKIGNRYWYCLPDVHAWFAGKYKGGNEFGGNEADCCSAS